MRQLVSVVVPTHNRAQLVERAVRSVLAQTYTHLECLVVDDASTDGTPAVLERLRREDARVVVRRHGAAQGASAARNTGIAAAAGTLIAFLDDDDLWLPRKLEAQVDLLERSPPGVGLVYCWLEYRAGDRVLSRRCPRLAGRVFPHLIERQRLGNASTLLVPRRVVAEVGGFDPDLPRGNDGDFIRRVALRYEVAYVPEVLVHLDVGHGAPRITDFDRGGVEKALRSELTKLTKFAAEIERYPRQRAGLYSVIGFHYVLLGEWRTAGRWFRRAVGTGPLYPGSYRPMLRAGKALVLRRLGGRRRRAVTAGEG